MDFVNLPYAMSVGAIRDDVGYTGKRGSPNTGELSKTRGDAPFWRFRGRENYLGESYL